MSNRPQIVSIGIATIDIYLHKNRMYPGGNELNIAYNVNGLGAVSGFMGVFADDKVGKILEQTLIQAGVDTDYSHHEKGSSGYALVDMKEEERIFLDWNKKGVTDLYPIEFTEEELEYIKKFDIACTSWGGRVPPEKIRKLYAAGISVSYDFYDNFTMQDIEDIAPYIKYGFFSCSHLNIDDIKNVLKRANEKGCEVVIGTRGIKGSIAFDGKKFYEQRAKKVKALDTMGAGDAFISAFLVEYLTILLGGIEESGNKINGSLQRAADFSAETVMKEGAFGIGYDVDPGRLSDIINLEL